MRIVPKIGDRVRVIGPMDDPDPIPVGTEGTVNWVGVWAPTNTHQIGVKWDNGRGLGLVEGDPFIVVG